MMPGVQKPHWLAPVAQNAAAHRSAASRPSTVVMRRPATRRAGVTHATRGWPSTSTVQHPHWPWGLQPSFTERTPRRSRRTVSSVGTVVGHLDGPTVDDQRECSGRAFAVRHPGDHSVALNAPHLPTIPPRRRLRSRWSCVARRLRRRRIGVVDDGGPSTDGDGTTLPAGDLVLGAAFDRNSLLVSGIQQRAAFLLFVSSGGLVRPDEAPATLSFAVTTEAGDDIGTVEVARHGDDIERAYYPLVTTFPATGVHRVATDVDGQPLESLLAVNDPSTSTLPQVGEPLPAPVTPTVAAPLDAQTICTARSRLPVPRGLPRRRRRCRAGRVHRVDAGVLQHRHLRSRARAARRDGAVASGPDRGPPRGLPLRRPARRRPEPAGDRPVRHDLRTGAVRRRRRPARSPPASTTSGTGPSSTPPSPRA